MPAVRGGDAAGQGEQLRGLADQAVRGVRIRAATPDDAAALAEIYAPYVTGSAVSFETEAPDAAEMRARIAAGGALYPWLAAEDEAGAVAGYAYAARFRPREAYRYAVETTIYLRPDAQGRGLGRRLYSPLLAMLETQGFTQAIAAIALPNEASVKLHEKLGFRHAGAYERIGYKVGGWWDVGLWQRPLAPAAEPPAEPRPFGTADLAAALSRSG
jgi:L-amino acid N-acyltransferase YncA